MTALRATEFVQRAVLLTLLATTLGGCASNPSAPVLLTLPSAALSALVPDAVATSVPSPQPPQPRLVLRRVTLPEYVVARRVRFRTDAATLAEWPNTYWAERIEIGVAREFGVALRQQLPGWVVCDTNCAESPPLLTLEVELLSMDFVRATRTLHARARVSVLSDLRSDSSGSSGSSGNSRSSGNSTGAQFTELTYTLTAEADTAQAHAQGISNLIRALAKDAAPLLRAPRHD